MARTGMEEHLQVGRTFRSASGLWPLWPCLRGRYSNWCNITDLSMRSTMQACEDALAVSFGKDFQGLLRIVEGQGSGPCTNVWTAGTVAYRQAHGRRILNVSCVLAWAFHVRAAAGRAGLGRGPEFHASHAPCAFPRCRTCQVTSSSAVCVSCFRAGDHEGHDYVLYRCGWGRN